VSRLTCAVWLALASGCATVTPGTVVLEVPVCSSSDSPAVLRQGRYWPMLAYCTNYYEIVSREQRAVWTLASTEGSPLDESITFAGKDGQKVNVDIGVGFVIAPKDEDVVTMVRTFGYDLDQTVHTRVRDSVRNGLNMCASTMSVDEVYGPRKEELFKCAEGKVQEEFNAKGLLITRLTLNSEVRLPRQVQEAMEASTAATQNAQRVEREVASAEAEGKKLVASARAEAEAKLMRASAEAESNRIIAASITRELLELRRLEIETQKAAKWDGKLPVVSGGEGTSLILDVGATAAVAGR
jgi:regulator of protease activity HflC (stomatin/prohibitin superfamily)